MAVIWFTYRFASASLFCSEISRVHRIKFSQFQKQLTKFDYRPEQWEDKRHKRSCKVLANLRRSRRMFLLSCRLRGTGQSLGDTKWRCAVAQSATMDRVHLQTGRIERREIGRFQMAVSILWRKYLWGLWDLLRVVNSTPVFRYGWDYPAKVVVPWPMVWMVLTTLHIESPLMLISCSTPWDCVSDGIAYDWIFCFRGT